MATKTTRKKPISSAKKVVKKEPSPSVLLKKVASVSDSNKALQKEIKVMSKIFGENQKVLVSMKNMIDTLTSTLEHIQKQSKQINIIEEDTQKLYAGLNQVRTQSNMVNKINDQTSKLQEEINKISNIQKTVKGPELSQQVEDSINSIRNNSQMIIKIAQRIDEVRDDLRKVSGKTDSFLEIGNEIDKLKNNIEGISNKTSELESGTQIIDTLRQEFQKIKEGFDSTSSLDSELNAIKNTIEGISSKASKIDSLEGVIDGLRQQFETVSAKASSIDIQGIESIKDLAGKIDKIETEIGTLSQRADSTAFVGEGLKSVQEDFSTFKQNVFNKTDSIEQKISSVSDIVKRQDESTVEFHKKSEKLFDEIQAVKNVTNKTSSDLEKASSIDIQGIESIKDLAGKIDKIETEIGTLSQRADSTAFVGEGLKSVQEDFSTFKQNVFNKTDSIEQKISSVSDIVKRQDESTVEFHKKSEKLFDEIQAVKNVTNKTSSDSSKEMMALLKLSEYQSNIRMNAESKYGDVKILENMASQTADIVNLFDRISVESGEKIPLPHEVRQWAISKILDCADKWEIRFSDVYSVLINAIGRDMLKESIRIQQIRDIYGIRAVDEIRKDLNIS